METTPHPLGKLAIPWVILLYTGIAWSIGAFSTYVLSLYFRVGGIDSSLEPLFEWSLVSDQDDLAGLLCYTVTCSLFSLLALVQIFKKKQSIRLPFPNFLLMGVALVKATLFYAPFWLLAWWAYESYRFVLPGDGNWLVIGVLTAIASFHWYRFRSLMPCSEEEEESE